MTNKQLKNKKFSEDKAKIVEILSALTTGAKDSKDETGIVFLHGNVVFGLGIRDHRTERLVCNIVQALDEYVGLR